MGTGKSSGIRAAIYLRTALGEPSITQQRHDCQRVASGRGWRIVAEYTDNTAGAYDDSERRPGYDTLVEASKAGQFDAVVCWDFDRLVCEPRQMEDWIDATQEGGLIVVTANGQTDLSTDGGRMHARIKTARSEPGDDDALQRTNATRAVIYLRESLDPTGEELGVTRQREDCQRIVAVRGWQLVTEYKDNSIGAYDKRKKRPGYDAMVEAYQIGRFDAIVCWDLDRLTRQPRQLEDWVDAAEDRGLIVVTANGEADLSTDGGRMYARIKAAVARAESERKAARQRRAAVQRAELGKPPLGVRLAGYTPKGEVVEHEAAVVRQMFERFHAGDSLRAIVKWLNETGVPTRHGKPWSPSSVRSILVNPRYCGRAIYMGETTGQPGCWPPIIAEDVWDAVNIRLTDPRRRKQIGTDRKHLGSGLYLCAKCPDPVVSHTRVGSGIRYRCRAAHFTRSAALIDQHVLFALRVRLAGDDVAGLLTTVDSPEAEAAAKEIRRLRDVITKTEHDYDNDLIDGRRYKIKTEKAKAQLAAAEAVQRRLADPSGVADVLGADNPVAAFDAATLGQQRAVLAFFMTVRLYPAPQGRKGLDPATVQIEWNR